MRGVRGRQSKIEVCFRTDSSTCLEEALIFCKCPTCLPYLKVPCFPLVLMLSSGLLLCKGVRIALWCSDTQTSLRYTHYRHIYPTDTAKILPVQKVE